MTTKTIIRHERPNDNHMVGDGFNVTQLMPGYGREMTAETSPFLMMDYNAPWEVPAQSKGHRPGVGYHPHRGFETVTIAYAGEIEHNDTRGNHGIIFADDVQWMTAGSGLMHNEYMSENFSKKGGTQHMVQLWVDLPAADKMTEPRYQSITKEDIPEVSFESGKIRVIAGEFDCTKGPAKTFSPIELYDIRFENSGKLLINLRDGDNTMMLVAAGSAKVNDKDIAHSELVYFSQKGDSIEIFATENSKILVMSGTPLGQGVFNYGPFVMDNPTDLMQAFRDYSVGLLN